MQLKLTDRQTAEPLRLKYLESLPVFQELYMEMLACGSAFYEITLSGSTAGYVAINNKILVEFYLDEKYIPSGTETFAAVLKELSVTSVYCKSFDFLLLSLCTLHVKKFEVIGTLFRDYISTPNYFTGKLSVREATERDMPFLLEQKDGLYETPRELETFVKQRCVLMFLEGSNLVGCGYLVRIHERWNYYDIGMWVNPDFRKRGFATQIISYLKHFCIQNHWKPIAGCAADNLASQKTLEKNGFYSKHKLIDFKIL